MQASLVAQWLRIHLPMQQTQVQALVQEDPRSRSTWPGFHNYWACALEPGSWSRRACVLRLLSPCAPGPRFTTREATAVRSPSNAMKSSSHSPQCEKPTQQPRPSTAKSKYIYFLKNENCMCMRLTCVVLTSKEMATHFSVLAWRIPGTGEPGGLPSTESHRVGHDWSDLAAVRGSVVSSSLQPDRLLHPWNFPGKNTGAGCHLQGIFPTQGLNPRLLRFLSWQVYSLPLAPPRKPPFFGQQRFSFLLLNYPSRLSISIVWMAPIISHS